MKGARVQVPAVPIETRAAIAVARCTLCSGLLDIFVPPFVTVNGVQLSGVTVYRCTACGVVETPAMRRPPVVEDDTRPKCAYVGCSERVPVNARHRHCSSVCRNRDYAMRKRDAKRAAAGRAA